MYTEFMVAFLVLASNIRQKSTYFNVSIKSQYQDDSNPSTPTLPPPLFF